MLPILFFLVPFTLSEITVDYNCTIYDNGFRYPWHAVSCMNLLDDASCKVIFPNSTSEGYPAEKGQSSRPLACYSSPSAPGVIDNEIKRSAIQLCPKTCGYCCQTKANSCKNRTVRINCSTITYAQCVSPYWYKLLLEDCPATCGFCEQTNECIDFNDVHCSYPDICTNPEFQAFANRFCKKTCNRCSVTSGK